MTMKLSEAIRLGAMACPQGFYEMFGDRGRSCVLGTAARAVGATDINTAADAFSKRWSWIFGKSRQRCPQCGDDHFNPMVLVMHLNDTHRWTREQIADWIATIEPETSEIETSQAETVPVAAGV